MVIPDHFGSINEIIPLNDDDQFKHSSNVSGNPGIKRGFFAAIDNVFGGGQSSTAQITQNINLISNNFSNVSFVS